MARAVAAMGVLCSLGLIGVSAFLNFRFGQSLADNEIDTWIYGVALVSMDGLKALMPFVALSAWAARHRIGGSVAWGVFALATVASLVASLGFAEGHRVVRGERLDAAAGTYRDALRALARAERAREDHGAVRSLEELEEARRAVLARPVGRGTTVGQASEGCTKAGYLSREHCEEYARLGVEMARSREAVRLDGELANSRRSVELLRSGQKAVKEGVDPQVAVLRRLWTVVQDAPEVGAVRLALGLLFALVVEVGSGVGLYLSTLLLRPGVVEQGEVRRVARRDDVEVPVDRPFGDRVKAYMAERWVPVPKIEQTAMHEAFDDYVEWCREKGYEPMGAAWVQEQLCVAIVAIDPLHEAIDFGKAGSNLVFHGVGLRKNVAAIDSGDPEA
ncbi:hypothetical protein [Hyphomicrobium sp. CS1BSMeth3]|uniref:hypothetical protein n=1 Tax=Hyphomicrobium sp. CS1BSMeth3 TaxID=1892844 RepID=UPI000930334B|nr:hypothetical protein [Hyphomicrobium sp. CS1BSMeth3]